MNENHNCERCYLHETVTTRSRCLKGGGGDDARLLIYFDSPNIVEDKRGKGIVSEAADWVRWALDRMSVPREQAYLDYVIKCYSGRDQRFRKKASRQHAQEACSHYRIATLQHLRNVKAIVAMGRYACEGFTGSDELKQYVGASWNPAEPFVRDRVGKVWVTYSPAYALQAPAEAVQIFRVLWFAALEAGLKPKINEKKTPFDYGT